MTRSETNSYLTNKFFSFSSTFLGRLLKLTTAMSARLKDFLGTKTNESVKLAGRFAGRKPNLHIERELLRRVKKGGFGKEVKQFKKLKASDFERSLAKSEKLLTSEVTFKGDKRKLIAAANRVRLACKFPSEKFRPNPLEQVVVENLNHSASAGFPYYQRKGTVIDKILTHAKKVMSGILPFPETYPTSRGFRLQQRLDEAGKDIDIKVRIMYPYPGVITALEAFFGHKFVTHFINTDTFYVIGKNGEKISSLINTRLKNKGKLSSFDVESFDQNMLNEVLITAFSILKFQLELSSFERFIFDQCVAYFCVSIMVSKSKGEPVKAFIKSHGLPSGSYFTNLVGTIAHAICIEYAQPGLLEHALVCGDDNLCVTEGVNLKRYSDVFLNELNLSLHPTKTQHFSDVSRVQFLGFEWVNGIRYVNTFLVINQLLWHTDFRTDLSLYDRVLARAASVLLNGINGADIFGKLFPEVLDLINMGIDVDYTVIGGTQPAPMLPILQGVQRPYKITQSLKLHLSDGWRIR